MTNPVETAEDALKEGRPADAVAALSLLAQSGRLGPLGQLTLARAMLASGNVDGALDLLRRVNLLNRDWPDAALALGRALMLKDALPAAIAEYTRALRLNPRLGAAELALAEAWIAAGEPDMAEAHLAEAAKLGENVSIWVTKLETMRGQARSDAGYVRHLFDQFAPVYDQRMREALAYRAPEILAELMAMVSFGKPKKTATLDLGCGTGLAAPAFRPFATKLSGIDLSPQMIAMARATALYDELVVGDLETWLEAARRDVGRVIAADVFVYIGDLARVFAGVKRVLKSGGLFLFTVEQSTAGGFVLQETKRWAHDENYIRRMAEDTGFEISGLMTCTPRVNKGVSIPGLACALRAP